MHKREEFRRKRHGLRQARQELRQLRKERLPARSWAERSEQIRNFNKKKQEIFRLDNELRAAKEQQTWDVSDGRTALRATSAQQTGALPDFAIIGAPKGGTSFLYRLLTQHPYVEPAALKELHFFDILFDEGTEWYSGCFPPPRLRAERKTKTGEATPGYFYHPHVPERMVKVVPLARLIVLLRNPVDRAYSAYHQNVRGGLEIRRFEAAVEANIEAEKARLVSKVGGAFEFEDLARFVDPTRGYLVRGAYVDHLMRWCAFFGEEQMLVLKSEDFFDDTVGTLKIVLNFLGLPKWEPEASEDIRKNANKGEYEEMAPATRRRLEEYFEPHNRRLYDFLGRDLGW